MPSQHRQIFIFDMTRHRSHLFFRYLGTHPEVQDVWHPFLPAFLFGPERMTQHTKNVSLDGKQVEWVPPSGTETYADVTDKFLHAVKDAEDKGKIMVANEHSQMVCKQEIPLALVRNQSVTIPPSSNPTVIPDEIFANLTPIFVIRNPVFAIPSNYGLFIQVSQLRPGGEDWKLATGVPIQRHLFDHFRERNGGRPPLVVDGDDVIWRTDELRNNLARALSLDPEGFSSVWEATPQEKRQESPILRSFLQTIDDSTGIERPSEHRPDADIGRAYAKWVDGYGQEAADQLRATVEVNMPHYEYMAQFKI